MQQICGQSFVGQSFSDRPKSGCKPKLSQWDKCCQWIEHQRKKKRKKKSNQIWNNVNLKNNCWCSNKIYLVKFLLENQMKYRKNMFLKVNELSQTG